MKRGMFLATLAAGLILEIGGINPGRYCFLARAQQKAAAAEIRIDNFSFGPRRADGTGWHHRDMD